MATYQLTIRDPYRNCDTTISAFAKAEHCTHMCVYLYLKRHGNLDGFRGRPKIGNGIKPHTYTHNGKYISIREACQLANICDSTLTKYKSRGITEVNDIIKEKAKRKNARLRAIPSDAGLVSPTLYARDMGVSVNTVLQYIKNHGDLKGFASRGHSRVNPKLYPHNGMGVSKTMKEWAAHFACSRDYIKVWLRTHGHTMDGFENRRSRKQIIVERNGRRANLKQWADILGTTYKRVLTHYHKHRTLDGFVERKRGRPKRNAA